MYSVNHLNGLYVMGALNQNRLSSFTPTLKVLRVKAKET